MLRRHRRLLVRAVLSVSIVLILLVGAAAWWLLTPLQPDARALGASTSDGTVAVVELPDRIEFTPVGGRSRVGVIVYPGARIEPMAYAPLARMVAERGYVVAVARMPYNLAVLDPDRAETVMDAHDEVATWVMCGHSLGGAMAARFADGHRDRVGGLVLLAAYAPGSTDLSDTDMPTVSVYGTLDGILNASAYDEAAERLPQGTTHMPIEGGNHAQFGDYGHQPGDNDAAITAEDQQDQALRAIGSVLLPLRIRTGGTQPDTPSS